MINHREEIIFLDVFHNFQLARFSPCHSSTLEMKTTQHLQFNIMKFWQFLNVKQNLL